MYVFLGKLSQFKNKNSTVGLGQLLTQAFPIADVDLDAVMMGNIWPLPVIRQFQKANLNTSHSDLYYF
jgi:hypothetical protein